MKFLKVLRKEAKLQKIKLVLDKEDREAKAQERR